MKLKQNKIISSLLAVLMVISMLSFSLSTVFAFNEGQTTNVTSEWIPSHSYNFQGSGLKPNGKIPFGQHRLFRADGKISYCIELGIDHRDGNHTATKSYNKLNANQQLELKYALIYGYMDTPRYGGTAQQEFIATQTIIWNITSGYWDNGNEELSINALFKTAPDVNKLREIYNKIKQQIKSHDIIPSFTNSRDTAISPAPTHKMSYNRMSNQYEITLTDTNNVLGYYDLHIPGAIVNKVGNQLTITSPAPIDVTVSARKYMSEYVPRLIYVDPMYLTANANQDKVTWVENDDPVRGYFKLTAPAIGSIELLKIDDITGNALQGAEFGLFLPDGTETARQTTGNDGRTRFDNVIEGSYYIQEITPPTGYELNTTKYPVDITTHGQVIGIEISNQQIKAKIFGTKKDGADFGLQGAEIGLFKANNMDTPIMTSITNPIGYFEFNDLLHGEYIVKEIKAPEGFILSDKEYPVTVDGTQAEILIDDIINNIITGQVKGMKTDAISGKPLAGANIGLYVYTDTNMEHYRLVESKITGEDGLFEFLDIPYGNYFVQEIESPQGYILSDQKYTVDITSQDLVIDISLINKPEIGSINLKYNPGEPNQNITNPKTRDNSSMLIMIACLVLGCISLGIVTMLTTEKRNLKNK